MTQHHDVPTMEADLAIIGAGASGAHTLLSLLEELSAGPKPPSPIRIVVIDRDPQLFTGIAYGNRSARTSLTLSTLNDFLPDDERARFIDWVAGNRQRISETVVEPAWAARHLAEVTAERWGELVIPRRLYGAYLAARTQAAMAAARTDGVAEFTQIVADVGDVERGPDGYLLSASDGRGPVTRIDARAIVLAIGSPPPRRLSEDAAVGDDLVHDVYDPGLEATLARLAGRLTDLPATQRRILVVGGNASALEFVLASQELLRDLHTGVTVLSPTGRPRHWRRKGDGECAELSAVMALKANVDDGIRVTAAELYEAVARDVRASAENGTDIASVPEIATLIPFFLHSFDECERAALAGQYGIPISNLLRQDRGDAGDRLESLVRTGTVDFRVGRYVECELNARQFTVTAIDAKGRKSRLDRTYGAIVGAIGFEKVSDTRAPLLHRLLGANLVVPSTSDYGLRVDDRFRAAPGLFVVGPLLAGNAQPNMVIWHAESVRRIMAIARAVAPSIALELATSPYDDSLTSLRNA